MNNLISTLQYSKANLHACSVEFPDPIAQPNPITILREPFTSQVSFYKHNINILVSLLIDYIGIGVDDVLRVFEKTITASRIVLLNTMKKYFNYISLCGCSIPKVTPKPIGRSLAKLRRRKVLDDDGEPLYSNSIIPHTVPSGIIKVPFCISNDLEIRNLQLLASVFGAKQDSGEIIVSPVTGWYVTE
ncbi:7367_t:CDS:2 [Ambispora gerdemannii]|uniref:7367_t:CDS:1 n=1 Tax=Ambispora gerdemannii TaxID=144530 RepID=A0A9N9DG60_9GLOM|nr:7367_t:CDS:2 [Ambispora gerdemannii]